MMEKHMVPKLSMTIIAFHLLVSISYAEDLYSFAATCKDKNVVAYRYSIDANGKVKEDKWSKGEKFTSKWNFKYKGGDTIILDGKVFPISSKSGPCLVFSDDTESLLGIGIWVYAINLKLKKIVAAQVQAGHGIINGVKTRSVCLDCVFDY